MMFYRFFSFLIVQSLTISDMQSMDFDDKRIPEAIDKFFYSLENDKIENLSENYNALIRVTMEARKQLKTANPKNPSYNPELLNQFDQARFILDEARNGRGLFHSLLKSYLKEPNCQFLSDHPVLKNKVENILSQNRAIPLRFVDLNRTKIVKQGTWEILQADDIKYDTLVTTPLNPCCGIYTFNPSLKTYGLYHTDLNLNLNDLKSYFKMMTNSCEESPLQLKIVTSSVSLEEAKEWESDSKTGLKRDQIRYHLLDIIQKKILPHIPPIIFPEFSFSDCILSPKGEPIYAPEIIPYQNPVFGEDVEKELKAFLDYLYPLACYFLKTRWIMSENDFPFDPDRLKLYFDSNETSFGFDKQGSVFSTNFPVSARVYGLPQGMKDLYMIPYRIQTYNVIPGKGTSIFKKFLKK